MSTNPTVQTPADLDVQAAAIGREHGTNAATWVEIGSTNAARVLAGIEDGDPAVIDSLNEPNLSGEYAGDYVSRDLARDLDVAYDSLDADQLMAFSEFEESYLLAAAESYWDAVAAACQQVIERDAIDALKGAGYPVEYVDDDALHVTSNTLSPYGRFTGIARPRMAHAPTSTWVTSLLATIRPASRAR